MRQKLYHITNTQEAFRLTCFSAETVYEADKLWIPGQGDGDSEMIVMGIPK